MTPRRLVLWDSMAVFWLLSNGSILTTGATLPCVLAVGLSLALTSRLLVLLNVEHPPAAATTLVISLGLMTSLTELAILMLAISQPVAVKVN